MKNNLCFVRDSFHHHFSLIWVAAIRIRIVIFECVSDGFLCRILVKFLQSKSLLGEVEKLEIEDLQGVYGLKALRVEVLYQEKFNEKSSITIQDLIGEEVVMDQ